MKVEHLDVALRKPSEHTFGGGASDAEIERAERDIGVRLCGSYRSFLERYGWSSSGSLELFGLGSDVPPYLDLVRVTQSERTEMSPRLRITLIPIWNDGGGNLYCLDTAFNPDEPPVVYWDHEQGESQQPDVVASDFASWVIDQLEATS